MICSETEKLSFYNLLKTEALQLTRICSEVQFVKCDCTFINSVITKWLIFFCDVSEMGSSLSVEITSQQMSTCLIRGLICMELQLLLHTVYKVLTDFCGKVYHHFSFANTFSIIYKHSVNGLLLMYFSFWSIIFVQVHLKARFPCSETCVTFSSK